MDSDQRVLQQVRRARGRAKNKVVRRSDELKSCGSKVASTGHEPGEWWRKAQGQGEQRREVAGCKPKEAEAHARTESGV